MLHYNRTTDVSFSIPIPVQLALRLNNLLLPIKDPLALIYIQQQTSKAMTQAATAVVTLFLIDIFNRIIHTIAGAEGRPQ